MGGGWEVQTAGACGYVGSKGACVCVSVDP
jgi:hypothetical protein